MPEQHTPACSSVSEISHLRGLTSDLLSEAPDSFLEFSPHPSATAAWKIFRHIGRVDENYTSALRKGQMQFGFQDSHYTRGNNKIALIRYLSVTLDSLKKAVDACPEDYAIEWFGEDCSLFTHLNRLANHESLHHGQLILYARAAGVSLPASWSAWGE